MMNEPTVLSYATYLGQDFTKFITQISSNNEYLHLFFIAYYFQIFLKEINDYGRFYIFSFIYHLFWSTNHYLHLFFMLLFFHMLLILVRICYTNIILTDSPFVSILSCIFLSKKS